jgi:hypothetical protein
MKESKRGYHSLDRASSSASEMALVAALDRDKASRWDRASYKADV